MRLKFTSIKMFFVKVKDKLLSFYPIKYVQKSIYYRSFSNGISLMEKKKNRMELLGREFNFENSFDMFNENEIDTIKNALNSREKSSQQRISEECFLQHGVYPISFSIPRIIVEKPIEKNLLVSDVKPSIPYSFLDEEDYLHQYERSSYALSFKKGGWDCFRHLEIMASGSIPLMPDASQIPDYTMTHYPKRFLQLMAKDLTLLKTPPGIVQDLLISWVKECLTSQKMAEYMLSTANCDSGNLVFIDLEIGNRCDYLGVMTLIGLKQLMGKKVTSLVKCDYIYEDYIGDTRLLYGRGFGYTKILNPEVREKEANVDTSNLDEVVDYVEQFGTIVINMRESNVEVAIALNKSRVSSKIIYLWGGDISMTKSQMRKKLRNFEGVHFCREIY
jgi:hypothetical protein